MTAGEHPSTLVGVVFPTSGTRLSPLVRIGSAA